LLTDYCRSKWGVGASPICSGCDKDVETTIHVLRDCPLATQIWIRLVPSNQISNFFSSFDAGTGSSRISIINYMVFSIKNGAQFLWWLAGRYGYGGTKLFLRMIFNVQLTTLT